MLLLFGLDRFRAVCIREENPRRRRRILFIDLGEICPQRPLEKLPKNQELLDYGTSDQLKLKLISEI